MGVEGRVVREMLLEAVRESEAKGEVVLGGARRLG